MIERFTVRMLKEAAEAVGAACVVEPNFGHVGYIEAKEKNADAKRFYFKLSALDVNAFAASKIAIDKEYTQYFLQKFGYSTIPTEVFFSDEWCAVNDTKNNLAAAVAYVNKVGYPRIVKPNSKSQGRGVAKVYSESELRMALTEIFLIDNIALIQPFIRGTDYRIVVYKDRVMMAYSRSPLTITGDGARTVRELLPIQNISLPVVEVRLKREYNFSLDSIPHVGQVVQLLDNANLSTGGTALEVTEILHKDTKELVVRAVHDLGLTFAGVDILTTDDITKPMLEYVIVEVNAMPGLEHYASLGTTQLIRVRSLYEEIVKDAVNP